MKKKLNVIILVLIILVGAFFYWQHKSKQSKVSWRTTPAQTRTITSSITATGTINPVVQVNVGTEVSGKIEKIYKDFNDYVKKGDLLARLDTQTLQMNLEDSRIELRKAQLTANENLIDLNTARELFENNMIAQFELQRAQYTYDLSLENIEKARFSVQRAETNLNNALIYSPIDGVIISRAVDEGQTVAASLNAPTLFIIANNLDEMQIEAQIDEADIGKVKNDMRVRFSVDAFPDMSFRGSVRQVRLNPIVEQNVVTYKVIISINNPERIIMPGMTANVEIIIDQKTNVVAIQERALQFRPTKEIWDSFGLKWDDSLIATQRSRGGRQGMGATTTNTSTVPDSLKGRGRQRNLETQAQTTQTVSVWVLENGTPTQISIETGISDGSFIQVVSGLLENQQVITGVNYTTLQTGTSSAFSTGMPGRF